MDFRCFCLTILCFSALILVGNARKLSFNGNRLGIFNGTKVKDSEAMSAVFIVITTPNATHQCGGALLNPDTVLTAAHCTQHINTTTSNASIIYGKHNIANYRKKDLSVMIGNHIKVKKFIRHPDFKFVGRKNDIAILKLEKKIENGTEGVEYINISRVKDIYGRPSFKKATAYGWGRTTSEKDSKASDDLMKKDMNILSKEECDDEVLLNNYWEDNSDGLICVSSPTGATCHGDSGSPLIHNNILIGVVSGGRKDPNFTTECRPNAVTAYVNVAHHLEFIKANSCGDFCPE